VPTFKEMGLPQVNRMAYYGIVGPKNLPKEVVDKINAAVRKAVQDQREKAHRGKRLHHHGRHPEAFAKQMAEELAVYKNVVQKQNLKMEE
jgi:tripartite-type tricarboxylate transporter receptor subunit TctC